MLVFSLLTLPSSNYDYGSLIVLLFQLSTTCLVCNSNFLPASCFVVYCPTHTLIVLSNSWSCIPSNAGPSPGTTGNLHLKHFSLYLIFTKHLSSCLCLIIHLSTIDIFIVEFNSSMVHLGNSILKF